MYEGASPSLATIKSNIMRTEYRVVSLKQAYELGVFPDYERYDAGDYRSAIVRFKNNKAIEFIGMDGGEPEDQTLYRDWGWVVGALNNAYHRGVDSEPATD